MLRSSVQRSALAVCYPMAIRRLSVRLIDCLSERWPSVRRQLLGHRSATRRGHSLGLCRPIAATIRLLFHQSPPLSTSVGQSPPRFGCCSATILPPRFGCWQLPLGRCSATTSAAIRLLLGRCSAVTSAVVWLPLGRCPVASKKRLISASLWGGRSLISLPCQNSGLSSQTAIILSSFSP